MLKWRMINEASAIFGSDTRFDVGEGCGDGISECNVGDILKFLMN
jgi:hypothetical protein